MRAEIFCRCWSGKPMAILHSLSFCVHYNHPPQWKRSNKRWKWQPSSLTGGEGASLGLKNGFHVDRSGVTKQLVRRRVSWWGEWVWLWYEPSNKARLSLGEVRNERSKWNHSWWIKWAPTGFWYIVLGYIVLGYMCWDMPTWDITYRNGTENPVVSEISQKIKDTHFWRKKSVFWHQKSELSQKYRSTDNRRNQK